MVVKQVLEPELEGHFQPDSYGYRPGKLAQQALGQARQRCWQNDWVLDLDSKGCFDNSEHALLLKALRCHSAERWILLYVERWLQAEVEMPDGKREARGKGTTQGGVPSPLLSNLYLHYAFDAWMRREFPRIPFERYADDIVCHCRSEAQANYLKRPLQRWLAPAATVLAEAPRGWRPFLVRALFQHKKGRSLGNDLLYPATRKGTTL